VISCHFSEFLKAELAPAIKKRLFLTTKSAILKANFCHNWWIFQRRPRPDRQKARFVDHEIGHFKGNFLPNLAVFKQPIRFRARK